MENKPRKQQGYSTVSHFNIVHYDCHLAAVRWARLSSSGTFSRPLPPTCLSSRPPLLHFTEEGRLSEALDSEGWDRQP